MNQSEIYLIRIRNYSVVKLHSFNCASFCETKRNNMQAAKFGLDLNRKDLADSLGFDMKLKTNSIDMIQIMKQK